jgi:small subunit ribosomal protein S20
MREAAAEGDTEKVQKLLPETFSIIDTGRRKGVLHRNTASRYKARMARQAQAVHSTEA